MRAIVTSLIAISVICLTAATSAILMGYIWTFVCWLRSYGMASGLVDPASAATSVRDYGNCILNAVAAQIHNYNLAFPGNSRFGSGLGIISGAMLGLGMMARRYRKSWQNQVLVRISAGASAGALIGGRIALTFGSEPVPFMVGIVSGAVLMALVAVSVCEQLPPLASYSPSARKPPSTETV